MKIDWLCGFAVNADDTITHYTRKDLMTEKFVSPCPPPTPHQRELLDVLIEEAAEVIQRATKMLRFGVEEVQPEQKLTNAERLDEEIGDMVAVIRRLQNINICNEFRIEVAARRKDLKLNKFLQTSPGDTE